MGLKTIYIVRHGFRTNWTVDHATGTYHASARSPTGIPSDPALAGYGVHQSEQLADKLVTLDPPIDIIYSSAYYRCIQTLSPTMRKLQKTRAPDALPRIKVDTGLGDFYGLAPFDHPQPAPLEELHEHFPGALDPAYTQSVMVPYVRGDTIASLHDRIAYTLFRIVAACDADPRGPKALLICTHAAVMIAMGRILTGRMPEDVNEEDFFCFTCALSKFTRRGEPDPMEEKDLALWNAEKPSEVPKVEWKGKGLLGGWQCELNGDCSFLSGGAERGWRFSGEEAFMADPNAFNDVQNEKKGVEGVAVDGKGSRL